MPEIVVIRLRSYTTSWDTIYLAPFGISDLAKGSRSEHRATYNLGSLANRRGEPCLMIAV
jgi:hypothetical protein